MIFCGNSPTHHPSAIQHSCPGGRKRSVTQFGLSGLWRSSASSNSRCTRYPIRNVQSPKSRARGSSSLRDVCIARIMCYSCVLQAARSRSYENISILCVLLGHLTRRSLVSNPEDNRRAKAFVGQGLIPHLETTLRLDRSSSGV